MRKALLPNEYCPCSIGASFLPGIIWANLDAVYGSGPKVDKATLALNSFLFGIFSYATVYLGYTLFNQEFTSAVFSEGDPTGLNEFSDEIAVSVPVSLTLAIIWLYLVKYRVVMRVLNFIGATRRFGTEDVWSFTFNGSQPFVDYVNIRDLKNDFIYCGYISAYSETEEYRELLLRDAIVYSAQADVISEAPHIYLSFPREEVWIEFPTTGDCDVQKGTAEACSTDDRAGRNNEGRSQPPSSNSFNSAASSHSDEAEKVI
ncbi:hypothetical protein [Roseivivax sp. CAU 1761]